MYFFGDKKYSAWTRLNPPNDKVMGHKHDSCFFCKDDSF